jgi:hypothetical protein
LLALFPWCASGNGIAAQHAQLLTVSLIISATRTPGRCADFRRQSTATIGLFGKNKINEALAPKSIGLLGINNAWVYVMRALPFARSDGTQTPCAVIDEKKGDAPTHTRLKEIFQFLCQLNRYLADA